MAIVLAKETEKGVTIATGLAWGAAMGGIQRVSPVTTTVLSFIGAIGGLIGAMTAKEAVTANMCEGIAAGSAAIFGLGLTAPLVATRVAGKPATGANKLLLKAAEAAKEVRVGSVAQVGAGLLE